MELSLNKEVYNIHKLKALLAKNPDRILYSAIDKGHRVGIMFDRNNNELALVIIFRNRVVSSDVIDVYSHDIISISSDAGIYVTMVKNYNRNCRYQDSVLMMDRRKLKVGYVSRSGFDTFLKTGNSRKRQSVAKK